MVPNTSNITLKIGVIFLSIVEFLILSIYRTTMDNYTSSVMWMVMGISVALFSLILIRKDKNLPQIVAPVQLRINRELLVMIFVVGAAMAVLQLQTVFEAYTINPNGTGGDIVPCIYFYVNRFLDGEVVYQVMQFKSWKVYSTYLPFTWLPFIPAEVFNFDYRWIPLIYFLLVIFFLYRQLLKNEGNTIAVLIKGIIPFFFLNHLIWKNEIIFGYSVELVAVSHYFVLCFSLLHRKKWIIALGLLLCLLSRYTITLWMPVYLLLYWFQFGFKPAFRIGVYVIIGILVVFVIPFLSQNWEAYFKGLENYSHAIDTLWQPAHWQAPDAIPYYLKQGMTLGIYFYDFIEGDFSQKLAACKMAHFIVSCLTALGILMYYLRNKMTNEQFRKYLLYTLKLYLVVFYAFFYAPFTYMYMVPIFLSIPVIYSINFQQRSF